MRLKPDGTPPASLLGNSVSAANLYQVYARDVHALQKFDSRPNTGVGGRQVALHFRQMTPLLMG
jgi:hypothetical protein